MFRMYGDYKFNPESDCYLNIKNGVSMDIMQNSDKDAYIHFWENSTRFNKKYCIEYGKDFEKNLLEVISEVDRNFNSKLEEFDTRKIYARKEKINDEEYANRVVKTLKEAKEKYGPAPDLASLKKALFNTIDYTSKDKEIMDQYFKPEEITKETIEECTNKSNAAEVVFLEKRVTALEERVDILEDSVEDLEEWRHR